MIQEPQPNAPAGWRDPDLDEECAECGADSPSDPVDGGLYCARCGQWQALCAGCMPTNVPESSRDAVWLCPECRERPFDS
jgi:DNA-directed RNA polymerase subunit RPC12/RpoP